MEPVATLNIVCGHCLTNNRLPRARLGEEPVCGQCGQSLLDGRPVELDDASFERFTRGTELPVLVDFWARWCGPCVGMAPQFEQAARELRGHALLAKVDVDASPQTAARFGIRSIPTLVRLDRGREHKRQAGALQAKQIVQLMR